MGSSEATGKNLVDPANQSYPALLIAHLKAQRTTHCRSTVVAAAGGGLFEQQATGWPMPANRAGVVQVNTAVNITVALAWMPHVVIVHHPSAHMSDAVANWGTTTEASLKAFLENEQIPLLANLDALCLAHGVLMVVAGSHPLDPVAISAPELAANLGACRKHWNDLQRAAYPERFIDYYDAIEQAGTAATMLADGRHCNTTGLALMESALEAFGLSTWRNVLTAVDIDP